MAAALAMAVALAALATVQAVDPRGMPVAAVTRGAAAAQPTEAAPASAVTLAAAARPPTAAVLAWVAAQESAAALAADAAGVRAAMIDWGQLQWPENAPRSVGVIADRVSSPLADELRALSRQSYGPEPVDWDGAALAQALRSFAILSQQQGDDEDLLPPLLPPATT